MTAETQLEMAERHVREGVAHVERQKARIVELRRDGHRTAPAEELLAVFEISLAAHRKNLDLILKTPN